MDSMYSTPHHVYIHCYALNSVVQIPRNEQTQPASSGQLVAVCTAELTAAIPETQSEASVRTDGMDTADGGGASRAHTDDCAGARRS